MKIENSSDQRKAKTKFFAVYGLSVLIIIAITASLLQTNASAESTETVVAEQKSNLQGVDDLLHRKAKEVNDLYASANNSGKAAAYLPLIQAAENSFRQTMDSLTTEMRNISGEDDRRTLNDLLMNFRSELQTRSSLFASYHQLQNAKPANVAPANTAELLQLRASLEEKDRQIASLQSAARNQPQPVVQSNSPAVGDLQNRLAKAKTANDKLQGQINAMKQSYQTVVEDNRRLLSQLQSARKQ